MLSIESVIQFKMLKTVQRSLLGMLKIKLPSLLGLLKIELLSLLDKLVILFQMLKTRR